MHPIKPFDVAFEEFIDSDTPEKREALSHVLRIPIDPTIRRWFKRRAKPVGEYKICLKVYFDDIGQRIQEMEGMKPVIKDAARILAYGLAKMDEIAAGFGYATGNRSTHMLALLQGGGDIVSARLPQAQNYVERYRAALDAERRRRVHPSAEVGTSNRPRSTIAIVTHIDLADKERVKAEIVEHIFALDSLVDFAVHDSSFTAQDRKEIRERLGFGRMAKFSTAVNQMCGETILQQLAPAARKGTR